MTAIVEKRKQIETDGFAVIRDVYRVQEIDALASIINAVDTNNANVRRSADVFAIRQFVKAVPESVQYIFNGRLKSILAEFFGQGYFVVKSIYFDKPGLSNWFVAYHQDLTIAVAEKHNVAGFCNWTLKGGQFAVQPPVEVLQNNFTVRIHLDDTNEHNGALKLVPGSHTTGVINPNNFAQYCKHETICPVSAGGVMIMKPLLLHASGRTVHNKRRRVIHVEFSKQQLPAPLQWGEKKEVRWLVGCAQ